MKTLELRVLCKGVFSTYNARQKFSACLIKGRETESFSWAADKQLPSVPVFIYQTLMVQPLSGVQPWDHAGFPAVATTGH